ncbi:ribokinase [Staphylospora marina]|uniref:ribokinase n=1 Tax=Staphylospora marina TaxID=2490858 RepID=UPI000F5B9797|nr:ribokinase [Staphylospora marina]
MSRKPRLVVVGSINMDVVIEAIRPPRMGETVMGESVRFIPGGKGANQAVAAARLDADVHMIGVVGGDPFGHTLLDSLRGSGVDTAAVRVLDDVPSGVAGITLAGGDNSIIVVPGANGRLSPDDVAAHEDRIAEADAVLLQLEIPMETVIAAARTAKRRGVRVMLNPAPVRELPDELLALTDVICPNRIELETLTGLPAEGKALPKAMRQLRQRGAGQVVVTLGADGAAFLDERDHWGTEPGRSVRVVDTTGAGDAFHAGLAVALAEGRSLPDAVRFAVCTGSLAVTRFGAQTGMPSRREVDELESRKN